MKLKAAQMLGSIIRCSFGLREKDSKCCCGWRVDRWRRKLESDLGRQEGFTQGPPKRSCFKGVGGY